MRWKTYGGPSGWGTISGIRWNPDKYVYHRQGATVDGKVVDYALTKRKCHSLHTRMEYLVAHLRKVDAVFAEWDGEDISTLPDWVRPGRANLVVHYIYYVPVRRMSILDSLKVHTHDANHTLLKHLLQTVFKHGLVSFQKRCQNIFRLLQSPP